MIVTNSELPSSIEIVKKKRLLTLEKEEKDENLLKVNRSQGGFTSKLYTNPNQAIATS
jgi:hypothetical protein